MFCIFANLLHVCLNRKQMDSPISSCAPPRRRRTRAPAGKLRQTPARQRGPTTPAACQRQRANRKNSARRLLLSLLWMGNEPTGVCARPTSTERSSSRSSSSHPLHSVQVVRVPLGLAPSPESLDILNRPAGPALFPERRDGVQLQLPLTGRNTCVRAAICSVRVCRPCSAARVPAAGRQEERDVCRKGTDVTSPVRDSVKEEKRRWHPGQSFRLLQGAFRTHGQEGSPLGPRCASDGG